MPGFNDDDMRSIQTIILYELNRVKKKDED